MRDIELNPISTNLRKLLQAGVALILALFLVIYFIFLQKNQNMPKNTTVTMENGRLQVFDDQITLNSFPDRIAFHYPYFIVVRPSLKASIIYNLDKKQKEKEVKEIVLDYYRGNILFNKGTATFYNKQDLGVLCEKAFIKSKNEVLCVTKQYANYIENKLIMINVLTKKQNDIYSSKNIITNVSVIGNDIYYGEVEPYTRKNYIYINKQKIEIPDIVSLIYRMGSKPYFVSFKSVLNNQKESYYLIEGRKAFRQEEGKIIFFK